jgi:hypothetical protein
VDGVRLPASAFSVFELGFGFFGFVLVRWDFEGGAEELVGQISDLRMGRIEQNRVQVQG